MCYGPLILDLPDAVDLEPIEVNDYSDDESKLLPTLKKSMENMSVLEDLQ